MPAGFGVSRLDLDLTGVEVDVGPVEARRFGRSEAGERADGDVWHQLGYADLEQTDDLPWREDRDLALEPLGEADFGGGILRAVAASPSGFEHDPEVSSVRVA